MKTALTIAGSDPSGGAGIQADIKTMTVHGVYAMSAVTALTVQNTTGVMAVMECSPRLLAEQIDAVFEDIRPDAVKIGMTASAELIRVIADRLEFHDAQNIVLDPVMISSSGSPLISRDAVEALKTGLFPLAAVITPNIPEAEVLSERVIKTHDDMITAARDIYEKYGCAVLCKGGHMTGDSDDLLYDAGGIKWFRGQRIVNPDTHGTGCTLSSAVASELAKGSDLQSAVSLAKKYVSGAIAAKLDLGRGSGPLDHAFQLRDRFLKD